MACDDAVAVRLNAFGAFSLTVNLRVDSNMATEWFYADGGSECGPLSGYSDWVPAKTVQGLFPASPPLSRSLPPPLHNGESGAVFGYWILYGLTLFVRRHPTNAQN